MHSSQECVYDIKPQAVAAALPAPGEVWAVKGFKQAVNLIVRDGDALILKCLL